MPDPNGWPDPARPGVPLNPERKAKHWLSGAVWNWCPEDWAFSDDDGRRYWTPPTAARHFQYEGPCLLPAEVAARVEEARAKALEEAAAVARRVEIPGECSPAEAHGRMTGALAAAEAIRALKEQSHDR